MDLDSIKKAKTVFYISAIMLYLVDAQDICKTASTEKLNYGVTCSFNSECVTHLCTFSRCGCALNTYYDACSTSCVPNCGSSLSYDGIIVSPFNVTQGSTCHWDITGTAGTYVTFIVDDLDMYPYNCDLNSLTVTDSNDNPLINKVCSRNSAIPNIVASSDSFLRINYTSTCSDFRGFRGKYYIRSDFTHLSEISGYIASPGFPVQYPRSSNYTWLISGIPGYIITLSILSARTECVYDNVNIYDGPNINSSLLASLCDMTTRELKSSSNQMLINFQTDFSVEYSGFSAFYRTQAAHGVQCNVSTPELCAPRLNCSSDQLGTDRCLCPDGHYHYEGECYPDSELPVSITTDTIVQASSVDLKWTTAARRRDAYYIVIWVAVGNFTDQGYIRTYSRDTHLVNLTPATLYELTITTIVPSDLLYYSKFINSTFRMETKSPYGYNCSENFQCDKTLNCTRGKCVCLQNQYFDNSTLTCLINVTPVTKLLIDELYVQIILIVLVCAGWITAISAVIMLCVQCAKMRKIIRNTCQTAHKDVENLTRPKFNGQIFSHNIAMATNEYKEVLRSSSTGLPTSTKDTGPTSRPNYTEYVNNKYQMGTGAETNDDDYLEIGTVSDGHIYFNR